MKEKLVKDMKKNCWGWKNVLNAGKFNNAYLYFRIRGTYPKWEKNHKSEILENKSIHCIFVSQILITSDVS